MQKRKSGILMLKKVAYAVINVFQTISKLCPCLLEGHPIVHQRKFFDLFGQACL
jgi:hypothetical protein